ncbi:transposase family protein [Kitasatospora sp. NPDC092039]|uniref:transposase family protein n=1 Tax=Kitasatospora sp. NPDC092039 TaxID=3364086 RepID=UPI00380FEF71
MVASCPGVVRAGGAAVAARPGHLGDVASSGARGRAAVRGDGRGGHDGGEDGVSSGVDAIPGEPAGRIRPARRRQGREFGRELAACGPPTRCPGCGSPERRRRSPYWRTLAELPFIGRKLLLRLRTRRSCCQAVASHRTQSAVQAALAPWCWRPSVLRVTVSPGGRTRRPSRLGRRAAAPADAVPAAPWSAARRLYACRRPGISRSSGQSRFRRALSASPGNHGAVRNSMDPLP